MSLLPSEPLLDMVQGSAREIADQCGVSSRTVIRWRTQKHGMRLHTADRIAVRLNKHPIEIWGEEEYFK